MTNRIGVDFDLNQLPAKMPSSGARRNARRAQSPLSLPRVSPATFPVAAFTKCNRLHAVHLIPTKSSSPPETSSPIQPCTLTPNVAHR